MSYKYTLEERIGCIHNAWSSVLFRGSRHKIYWALWSL